MKITITILYVILPLFLMAQRNHLSGMYAWKDPVIVSSEIIFSTILFEGKAHDMAWLQLSSNTLMPSSAKNESRLTGNEEHLMVIKSGGLTLGIKGSLYHISTGSIALLMPGDVVSLQNKGDSACHFYVMKYRSKLAVNSERGHASGGPLVKDWNSTEFKAHEKGGRRDFFDRPTAMCKRFEMLVTTLNQGMRSHDPHTHRAEEIILVTDGKTEMQVGSKFHKGANGSVYFLGSNVPHAIRNTGSGTCTYFAFQFE